MPAHTVVFGARSFEPEEVVFLAKQKVRVITQAEIAQRGFQDAFVEAEAIVTGAATGFGISIDLDVIDPMTVPGVGSPEPGGLKSTQVLDGLCQLAPKRGLLGLEIVEYNPDRDRRSITAQLIGELIEKILT